MPISKRRLTKWRKEALKVIHQDYDNISTYERSQRILLLTQELLDQQLLKEK